MRAGRKYLSIVMASRMRTEQHGDEDDGDLPEPDLEFTFEIDVTPHDQGYRCADLFILTT
jgi:hypothetical protein